MREDDRVAADSLIRKEYHLTGALAAATSALVRQPTAANVDGFRTVSRDTAGEVQWEIAWLIEDLDSLDVADRLLRPVAAANSGAMSRYAYWMLMSSQLARGRWASARVLLDSAMRQPSPVTPSATFKLAVALPFVPVPRAQLDSLRRLVADDWPSPGEAPVPVRTELRLYVRGVLSARAGDYAAALRSADSIERMPAAPGEFGGATRGFAAAIRATVAFDRGDYTSALEALDRVPATMPLRLLGTPAGGDNERYLRAESLFRLGRLREALPWYEHGFRRLAIVGFAAAWDGPCYIRLGEIHDRLGDPRKAALYYGRAVALWKDADPALQPTVAAARRRLQQLTAEGAGRP